MPAANGGDCTRARRYARKALGAINNQIDPKTIGLKGATDGKLVVKGEGTWTVDNTAGTVTFTPEEGFTGTATPVTYTASDRKGVKSKT